MKLCGSAVVLRKVLSFSKFVTVCEFNVAETIRTIRDGEPRTATSTFTQVLSSACVRFAARRKLLILPVLGTVSVMGVTNKGS